MMLNRDGLLRTVLLGMAISSLSSCTWLDGSRRMKDPAAIDVLPARDGRIVSEAVTSDRRVVVYRGTRVCLEAPPDTASNISASYSGALDATLKAASQAAAPAVKAGYDAQLATALGSITNPSQGILYMRFVMAAACTAYMNDAITGDEYFYLLNNAVTSAMNMTMFELEKNGGKVGNNVVSVNESAPTLSGNLVSLDQAQQVASDVAASNSSGSGSKNASDAGKEAAAALKAKTPADASVETLAKVAGQVDKDAVLKATNDPAKAEKAQVQAIGQIYALAATKAAAKPQAPAKASSNTPTPNFLEVMRAATAPMASMTGFGPAAAAEQKGFQALLNRDMPTAISAFNEAYQASPTFHSVDEIRRLLDTPAYAKLTPSNAAGWQQLYVKIVKNYSWHAPKDSIAEMRKRASI